MNSKSKRADMMKTVSESLGSRKTADQEPPVTEPGNQPTAEDASSGTVVPEEPPVTVDATNEVPEGLVGPPAGDSPIAAKEEAPEQTDDPLKTPDKTFAEEVLKGRPQSAQINGDAQTEAPVQPAADAATVELAVASRQPKSINEIAPQYSTAELKKMEMDYALTQVEFWT